MNLESEFAHRQSTQGVTKIVRYVGRNPARFKRLIAIFLNGPPAVKHRAAWTLSYCTERHPELIRPYFNLMLRSVSDKKATVAVKRSIVRLLQFVEIPVKLHGKVASVCFGFLSDHNETVAVKVFSMTVLSGLAEKYPAIASELLYMLELQLPYSSAGFRSRAQKIIARHKCNILGRWKK